MSLNNKIPQEKLYAFEVNGIMKAIRKLFRNIIELSSDVNNCVSGFGAWETKSVGSTYLAATDGFVIVYLIASSNNQVNCTGYTDSSSSPTTVRGFARSSNSDNSRSFCMPVKAGEYWKTSQDETGGTTNLYWIPLNKQY